MKNVAGAGSRWVDVSAERFPGWIASFARRHADPAALGVPAALAVTVNDGGAVFTAQDGSLADCRAPFPESLAPLPADAGPEETARLIAAHASAPRAVGVLLVRLGGYAAGVFAGYPPALADAKTGSRPVHGRSAAGGWSQHRFARRREKQANEALGAAADAVVAVFGRWESGIAGPDARWQKPPSYRASGPALSPGGTTPRPPRMSPPATAGRNEQRKSGEAEWGRQLDAVVLGGDKRAVAELSGDPRLARYLALATERFITVPDPKRAVLEGTPRLFASVRIRLTG